MARTGHVSALQRGKQAYKDGVTGGQMAYADVTEPRQLDSMADKRKQQLRSSLGTVQELEGRTQPVDIAAVMPANAQRVRESDLQKEINGSKVI